MVEKRTVLFSMSATIVAKVRHGIVDIAHRMSVFVKDFQNSGSSMRYRKFSRPMIWKSPMPRQFVNAKNMVNAIGMRLKTPNRMK